MPTDRSLYDRLGGRGAIEDVVGAFYDRVLSDESVNHHFEDTDVTRLRAHQVQFVSAVTGGPVECAGDDTRAAHEGRGITDAEFDAVADHFDAALEANGASEEDRERVSAEVEALRPEIVEVVASSGD